MTSVEDAWRECTQDPLRFTDNADVGEMHLRSLFSAVIVKDGKPLSGLRIVETGVKWVDAVWCALANWNVVAVHDQFADDAVLIH